MKVDIQKKVHPNLEKYNKEDLDKAYKFTNEIHKELGTFVKAVILFGSTAKKTETPKSDIDILVIVDDLSVVMSREVVEAYRVIIKKSIVKTSTRLHVTTLRITAFWEYIRNGDPIAMNMLREGVSLIDTGFFDPMQALLKKGKIRPTDESIWTYYVRSPRTLNNSKWHIMQATVDLYWAVVDAAHAALMKLGEVPPTPEHVGDMLEKTLVKKKKLPQKYVTIMRNFYKVMKMISHREIKEVKGEEYDRYLDQAHDFVERMRSIIEEKK